MHSQKIEIALPAQLDSSAFLREVSSDVFKHAGFTTQWMNRLKLALDEMFNNAVQYGSEENGMVYITFLLDEKEISFQVEDEGKGAMKISAKELEEKIKKNLKEMMDMSKDSGRGLALIGNFWADELTIKDSVHGGIKVEFKKKIIRHETGNIPQLPLSELNDEEMIQIISLEGGLDAFNLEEKMRPIAEVITSLPEKGALILDCSELEYFNSTFIGQLANWQKEAEKRGAHLLMKNTNPETSKILDLVGLRSMIYERI